MNIHVGVLYTYIHVYILLTRYYYVNAVIIF